MKGLGEILAAAVDHLKGGHEAGLRALDRGHLTRDGRCLACSHEVSTHWDSSNRFAGCLHARSVARRAERKLHQFPVDVSGEASGERGRA